MDEQSKRPQRSRRRWRRSSALLAVVGLLLFAAFATLDPAGSAAGHEWRAVVFGRSASQAAGLRPVPSASPGTARLGAELDLRGPAGAGSGSAGTTPPAQDAAARAPLAASPGASDAPRPSDAPLQLPGPVPERGEGTFTYADGSSAVFGTAGPLRRFRVAVERGSGEDIEAFATQVQAALGDVRSWTGGGRLRLQKVSGEARHDFTVYLATRETAGRMCRAGGTNIRVGGRPYTSCRTPGRAIINLDRWRLSAPTFARADVPLEVYRSYVVNHEVGHELGEGHQGCPRRGGPAPVMVQQTLTLRGCTPYPWPRRDGENFAGPRI